MIMPDKRKAIVPDIATQSDLQLVAFVYLFAENLIRLVSKEDIPSEALLVYALKNYVGDVLNGGHAQYFGLLKGDIDNHNDSVDGALSMVGANGCLEIFREARNYIYGNSNALSYAQATQGFGKADKTLSNLDRRFYELDRGVENITALAAAHIRRHALFVIVPEAQWKEAWMSYAECSPTRPEMAAAEEKRRATALKASRRRFAAIDHVIEALNFQRDASRSLVHTRFARNGQAKGILTIPLQGGGRIGLVRTVDAVEIIEIDTWAKLAELPAPPDFPHTDVD